MLDKLKKTAHKQKSLRRQEKGKIKNFSYCKKKKTIGVFLIAKQEKTLTKRWISELNQFLINCLLCKMCTFWYPIQA